MPPLLADFIYGRVCELKCEKFLTRPLHGGSLLKPPSPLKQGRHSWGIRNGGLDFVKAAVNEFMAWRLSAERRLFFFCRRPADNFSI